MAFPEIASSSSSSWNSTSHETDLPSGVTAGDLLILLFGCNSNPTLTGPDGWTQLIAPEASNANHSYGAWYRFATGSDDNPTVGTSASQRSETLILRITGAHASTPPEAGTTVVTTSSTANPDPPSLNPSGWDVEDTLWLAMGAGDKSADGSRTATAAPDNYTDLVSQSGNILISGVMLFLAERELAAASEDPGAFTLSTSDQILVNTVAVRPAEAAGFTGTGAVTALAPTSASTGSLTFSGTAAVAAVAPTSASTGSLTFSGTSALTSLAPTVAASGPVDVTGTAAVATAVPGASASAKLTFSGSAAVSAAIASAAVSAKQSFAGTIAVSASAAAVAASGKEIFSGAVAVTASGSIAAAGDLKFAGTSAVTAVASVSLSGSTDTPTLGTATVDDSSSATAVLSDVAFYAIVSDSTPYQASMSDEVA